MTPDRTPAPAPALAEALELAIETLESCWVEDGSAYSQCSKCKGTDHYAVIVRHTDKCPIAILRLLAQQPAAQAPAETLVEEGAALQAESEVVFKADIQDTFGLAHALSMQGEMLGRQARYITLAAHWAGEVVKARAALAEAEREAGA